MSVFLHYYNHESVYVCVNECLSVYVCKCVRASVYMYMHACMYIILCVSSCKWV